MPAASTTDKTDKYEKYMWYLLGFLFILILLGSLIIYSHDMAQEGIDTTCGIIGSVADDFESLFSC